MILSPSSIHEVCFSEEYPPLIFILCHNYYKGEPVQLYPRFRQRPCPGPAVCLLTSLIRTPAWPAEAGYVLIQCIDPSGELFKFSQDLFVTLHCYGTVHGDAVKRFQLIV